jgi:hypothetical protein
MPIDIMTKRGFDSCHEVERIISRQKYRGIFYYQIKWKGWQMSDNTWEPSSNFSQTGKGRCEMIKKFNANAKAKFKNLSRLVTKYEDVNSTVYRKRKQTSPEAIEYKIASLELHQMRVRN